MKTKARRGLPLKEFLEDELQDKEVRAHFEEAEAEWLVARRVADARRRANITQAELAKRVKTTQQAISRIEAGEQNTTVDMLWRIAKALGTGLRIGFFPRKPSPRNA